MTKPSLKNQSLLGLDEVREIIDYDPVSGIFVWKDAKKGSKRNGRRAGSKRPSGHRHIRIKGIYFLEHRLAWFLYYGVWPKLLIDHIDGVGDNNKISNLREATQTQNMWNTEKQKRNKSGFKGVHLCKRTKRFCAHICLNGKNINLGYFDTAEEASKVYQDAVKENRGHFLGNQNDI